MEYGRITGVFVTRNGETGKIGLWAPPQFDGKHWHLIGSDGKAICRGHIELCLGRAMEDTPWNGCRYCQKRRDIFARRTPSLREG